MGILDNIAQDLGLTKKSSDNSYIGIGGFIAECRINDSITRTSYVPEYVVEDGSILNDHIVNAPLSIQIDGEIADIYIQPSPIVNEYQKINEKLGVIEQYIPAKTATQLSKIKGYIQTGVDAVAKVDKVIGDINYLLSAAGFGTDVDGHQKDFVKFLESNHKSKQLITIETALGIYSNMRITSYTLGKYEKSFLNYSISLIEFRTAKTILKDASLQISTPLKDKTKTTGDAKNQTADKQQKGDVAGKKPTVAKTQSLATKLGGLF